MNAVIVYQIQHMSFGDRDSDTGWWLVRLTITKDHPSQTIDTEMIAKFRSTQEMQFFDEYCKAHHRVGHKDLKGMEEYLRL